MVVIESISNVQYQCHNLAFFIGEINNIFILFNAITYLGNFITAILDISFALNSFIFVIEVKLFSN